MSIVSTEISFDSIFITTYNQFGRGSHGSGYCKEQNRYNRMVKKIKIFGFKIWSYVMEYELVPTDVWVSRGALGYDDSGWKSKWSSHPNFRKL
jgi:hypothetical protein